MECYKNTPYFCAKGFMSGSELPPICFLHMNTEMLGSLLNVGKGEIPLGITDVLDLIEPRHCIAHMGSVCQETITRHNSPRFYILPDWRKGIDPAACCARAFRDGEELSGRILFVFFFLFFRQ